jgi:hypothetical protein
VFERFTDRARRVVVLAQTEATGYGQYHIGPEHILLGLISEGEGVGAQALEALGISLESVRQQVEEEIIGPGEEPQQGHIPFTPQAKKVLELSLRESQQLGHNYIGTEHILLGLIREGEGVAAQVLVRLDANLSRVRQQVLQLLEGHQGDQTASPGAASPGAASPGPASGVPPGLPAWVKALESRLSAIEQRVGTEPDTSDLDEQIAQVRRGQESAIDARDFEQAASRHDHEKELLASKAARQHQWQAAHPGQASLTEQVRHLGGEVERLRGLLRRHGIEPEDHTA